MARIRTIKPDFWTDEKLSECSVSARLVFIGLWTFADDEGRMEYQPARIRMQLFPCGSVTQGKLMEYLRELSERSLIRVYTVDGKDFLDVPNFAKHQKINRPTPSRHPAFSGITHGGLKEPSALEGNWKGTGSISGLPKQPRAPAEGFAEIRAAYPKRAGSQKWGDAERAYRKRLGEGHTPEQMLAGVKRYAELCRATDRIGRETVMQAATFFGENRSFLEAFELPPKAPPPQRFNGSTGNPPAKTRDELDLEAARAMQFPRHLGEPDADYLARFRPWNASRIAKLGVG